jgi:pimeloyl-ACP methyl ester carboxylesterase
MTFMVRQQLINTPSGPVEFAIEGSGPPILYFHGTPCGNELMLEWERSLLDSGFQLVLPHRPGFYGTPLAGRTSTADCADLAALVLDHVGIDRVMVIGTSAGGPPAMAFAIRFPERTAALVLQCAQVHRWDGPCWAPPSHAWLYHMFRSQATRWLYCQLFPVLFRLGFPTSRHYLKDLSGPRYRDLQKNREALELVVSAHRTVKRFRGHRDGYYNDLSTWFRENVLSSGEVASPTLLLYDPLDPIVPFCHAEYAANSIRSSQLVELHAGGHLLGFGRDASLMKKDRDRFLRRHSGHGNK